MERISTTVPPHFLVIVPGMMGSKLRDRRTGKLVWLDFDDFPLNPFQWDDWVENMLGQMVYPNDDLEPAGIMDRVMFMSPWARQEQYSRLVEAIAGMGYNIDPELPTGGQDAYTFSYDWRQDIRVTGRQLGEAIERWHVLQDGAPAWIIGHSMGGIAARWYIEKEGGKDVVSRLFLMASPWNGAPKAMNTLLVGLNMFTRARLNPMKIGELTRRTVRSFPSAYQILPHRGFFLQDKNGNAFDPYADTRWLENEAQRAMMADALRFNEELGTSLSVDTLCIFGRKVPTVSQGIALVDPAGIWGDVTWEEGPTGDGSVVETSAVHEAARQAHPFVANHGSIYVHPGVLDLLQWELRDRYLAGGGARETQPVPTYDLAVTTDREQYVPGATILLRAEIDGLTEEADRRLLEVAAAGASAPDLARDGVVRVRLAWQSGLPGNPPIPDTPEVVEGVLHRGASAVEFVGEIRAPHAEGYYRLLSAAWVGDIRVTDTDLLIVDDGYAGWSIDPATGHALEQPLAGAPD